VGHGGRRSSNATDQPGSANADRKSPHHQQHLATCSISRDGDARQQRALKLADRRVTSSTSAPYSVQL
jgi:hypothetical protein